MAVVRLGDGQTKARVQSRDKIEKIHGVDFQIVLQMITVGNAARIDVGGDGHKVLQKGGADVGRCQRVAGSITRRSISVSRRAPRRPSLTRWSAARVTVTVWRGTTASPTTIGRCRGAPKPTSATCGG